MFQSPAVPRSPRMRAPGAFSPCRPRTTPCLPRRRQHDSPGRFRVSDLLGCLRVVLAAAQRKELAVGGAELQRLVLGQRLARGLRRRTSSSRSAPSSARARSNVSSQHHQSAKPPSAGTTRSRIVASSGSSPASMSRPRTAAWTRACHSRGGIIPPEPDEARFLVFIHPGIRPTRSAWPDALVAGLHFGADTVPGEDRPPGGHAARSRIRPASRSRRDPRAVQPEAQAGPAAADLRPARLVLRHRGRAS